MNEHEAFQAHDRAVKMEKTDGRHKEIIDTWTTYKKAMVQRELEEIGLYPVVDPPKKAPEESLLMRFWWWLIDLQLRRRQWWIRHIIKAGTFGRWLKIRRLLLWKR